MFKDKISKYFLSVVIMLSALLGFFAGLTGSLVFKAYLADNIFPEFREINLSNGSSNTGLVIRDAKKVVVEQNDKIYETINNVTNSLVGIYKKSDISGPTNENFAVTGNYLYQGVIITSDGWIISDFGSPDNTKISDFVIITRDKKIYNIDKLIRDKNFNLNFIHIKAADLPVLSMAMTNEIKEGELVISTNWSRFNYIGNISIVKSDNKSKFISSEDNNKIIELVQPISKIFHGGALFNLSGTIYGLINEKGAIVPAAYLENSLKSILKFGAIKKPILGITYIDLAQTVINPLSKGALIETGSSSVSAVLPKSPAETAKLKKGDVIISVNNGVVDSGNDLSLLIGKYLPGDSIKIIFIRDKKEVEADIILGGLR